MEDGAKSEKLTDGAGEEVGWGRLWGAGSPESGGEEGLRGRALPSWSPDKVTGRDGKEV